jgi:hypothetical protein
LGGADTRSRTPVIDLEEIEEETETEKRQYFFSAVLYLDVAEREQLSGCRREAEVEKEPPAATFGRGIQPWRRRPRPFLRLHLASRPHNCSRRATSRSRSR